MTPEDIKEAQSLEWHQFSLDLFLQKYFEPLA